MPTPVLRSHRVQSAASVLALGRNFVLRLLAIRGWYELLFIFLLLLIVEWIIPGPASLAHLKPHPFWIPVILVSVQYGGKSGLFIAGLATALSWVAGWPAQTVHEDFYGYSMRIWREPVLWIFGALVVGGLRDRQLTERRTLQERLLLSEVHRDTVGAFAGNLQIELNEYERKLATVQVDSAEAALQTLHELRSSTEDDTRLLFEAAVAKWLGDAAWSLYPFNDQEFGGLAGIARWPQTKRPGAHELLNAILTYANVRQKRVLSVFDEDDSNMLDGLGVFACRLTRRDGSNFGIFVVESIPSNRLAPSTADAVGILVDALADRLNRINNAIVPLVTSKQFLREGGEGVLKRPIAPTAASVSSAQGGSP